MPALLVTSDERVERRGELSRPAQRRAVAAWHLDGLSAEPVLGDAAHPGGGEEAVVATEEERRWDRWERREWERISHHPPRLAAPSAQRLGRQP